MSTNRSKTSHGKSIRRSSPNARIRRRRIHQQPIQGRYPVLPPIGHSWTPLGPYQPVGHQGFMIPAMTYPMLPYQQMVPYVPQSGVPTNTMLPSLPQPCMAAPPTSMMCYYVPWLGVYQQTESDNSITELPPDELVEEENDQIPEGSFSYMHQTLMYHDSVFLLKVCEEICSEIVESVVTGLAKETVTTCIDDMVKSYLGQARLLSASSLERRPKPKLEELRPSTNPTPSRHQQQGVSTDWYKEKQQLLLQHLTMQPQDRRVAGLGHSAKRAIAEPKMKVSTKDVAEHICLILLDELLFQQLLEVAVTGSVHKTSEALAGSILNELLFQECLKLALGKQSSSKTSHVPL